MRIAKVEVEVKIDVPLSGLAIHEIRVRLHVDLHDGDDLQAVQRWLYHEAVRQCEQNKAEYLTWLQAANQQGVSHHG